MTKLKFGFVILHYLSEKMTIECINTILQNYGGKDIFLVVIDNASPNGSGKRLFDLYNENSKIKIILSDENLGFGKGNNLGYKYLKENFDCDFIVVMNNDVLINQKDFLEKIEAQYIEKQFGILGPDIYNPKCDEHQNPVSFKLPNIVEAKEMQKNFKYYSEHQFKYELKKFLTIFSLFKKQVKKVEERINHLLAYEDIILHGACYIFSKDFITLREYAFNPKTFMFYEEEILFFETKKLNLPILYSPKLNVVHMEDVSTNMKMKSRLKKEKWKAGELAKSINVYIELLENSEKAKHE